MRDPSGIIFAVLLLVGAVVAFVAFAGWLRRRQEGKPQQAQARNEEVVRQREEQARLRKQVEAGTHVLLPGGAVAPKCYACDEPATMRPRRWVRDAGFWDLVRRKFGAPAKVRVGTDGYAEPVACEAHVPLLDEEYRQEVAEQEMDRAKLEAEHETRRARFQREGVYERARAKIAKHEREIGGRRRKSEVPAKVVPFSASSRTGTDNK